MCVYFCLSYCVCMQIYAHNQYTFVCPQLDSFILPSSDIWTPFFTRIHLFNHMYTYIYIYILMRIYIYTFTFTYLMYMYKNIPNTPSSASCRQHTLQHILQHAAARTAPCTATHTATNTAGYHLRHPVGNTHCNTLQHTLHHELQHILQHTLQHTATHTAPQTATHTATHTATQHTIFCILLASSFSFFWRRSNSAAMSFSAALPRRTPSSASAIYSCVCVRIKE